MRRGFYDFYVSTQSPLAAEVLGRIRDLYAIKAEMHRYVAFSLLATTLKWVCILRPRKLKPTSIVMTSTPAIRPYSRAVTARVSRASSTHFLARTIIKPFNR